MGTSSSTSLFDVSHPNNNHHHHSNNNHHNNNYSNNYDNKNINETWKQSHQGIDCEEKDGIHDSPSNTNSTSSSFSPTLKHPLYRMASTNLKRMRLPKKIILVRHGESLGNVEEAAYCRIPDWKIPLTEKGKLQARQVGVDIKDIINDEPVAVYCSPYLRTKQTLNEMMKALDDNPIVIAREEPRLTEQQFGNFQHAQNMNMYKNDRSRFGRFYYRFPQGEAGLDVFNRVTLFIGTLFREWERESSSQKLADTNIIIVTHGLTLRLFLMRWFHYSVTEFEKSDNPKNGAIVVLSRECTSSSYSSAIGSGIGIGTEETVQEFFTMDEESMKQMNFRRKVTTDKARDNLNILLEEAGYSEVKNQPNSESIPLSGSYNSTSNINDYIQLNNVQGIPSSMSSSSFGSIFS